MSLTGTEVIAEARRNFGETTALTLQDTDFQRWVNTALRELYEILPLPELVVLAETSPVTLIAGKGDLPSTLDHLLGVEVGGVSAIEAPRGAVEAIDANPYFVPFRHVFASDGEHLWVRGPSTPATVDVTFIQPPAKITDLAAAVVLPKWHAPLVLLVTALAYAQEEDKGQAQHYRNEALALINRTFTAPEQEGLQ